MSIGVKSSLRGVMLGALAALLGCGGGSGGSSGPPGPGVEAAEYKVWTAWIPDAAAADAARADLIASNGVPVSPPWTGVDGGLTTKVFDPAAAPTAINAILIQISSLENYSLDSVEVLDAQDRVVEYASGPTWSNLVGFPDDLLGSPDGTGALTEAAGDTNAFLFTVYAGPVDRFRINARGDSKLPSGGDVMAVGGFTSNFNERPGGLAVDKDGAVYLTLTVDKSVRLARYGLDGAFLDDIMLDTGISATAGSHSVAIDGNGAIFTAATMGGGEIEVRRHDPDLSEVWSVNFLSGLGGDRVESNGLAVDGDGNVVVAGGMNSSTGGINHWLAGVSGTGAVLFDKRLQLDQNNGTYWRGVTTTGVAGNHIYVTGDQASELLNLIQMQTARFSSSGGGQWDDQFGGEDALPDAGNAIGYDWEENLIVAGFTGSAAQGRNAALIRYGTSGAFLQIALHNGLANGNDEILDIAVEAGAIYAVGYETAAGQGENMWIRKYDSAFNPVWTRTHHGGFGNDRAISVAVHGDQLVVAGFETVSGGKTKLVLRVYSK